MIGESLYALEDVDFNENLRERPVISSVNAKWARRPRSGKRLVTLRRSILPHER